jgi:hypothetical protein
MDKMIKLLGVVLVVGFLIMFFSSSSGYYEYELNKKSNLTQEAILKFEQDVKDGKEIDINDYLIDEAKDYSNSFSNIGLNISDKIGTIFSKGVKFIFNSIDNMIDE